ncbi:MAG: antibiotic biosynthesis monooxygenase family protein [Desulfobacteraceae bacterium]
MVKIFIERTTIPGNELSLNKLLTELRSLAMKSKGYISGETLRSLDDPNTFIVISTWDSLEDWKAWEKNEERQKIQGKIDDLLRGPTMHRIFGHY